LLFVICHRDIKPDNFLLSSNDQNAVLKATGVLTRACVFRSNVEVMVVLKSCVSRLSDVCYPADERHIGTYLLVCTHTPLTCARVPLHADFGISRFMKPGETTDEFMGTPSYMVSEHVPFDTGSARKCPMPSLVQARHTDQ